MKCSQLEHIECLWFIISLEASSPSEDNRAKFDTLFPTFSDNKGLLHGQIGISSYSSATVTVIPHLEHSKRSPILTKLQKKLSS